MTHKKLTAKDLIRTKTTSFVMPPPDAITELKKLFVYNDSEPPFSNKRVGTTAAIELLKAYGFACGRDVLTRVCRELGRKSYATP